ncbi:hypothetical protein TNCV_822541 [Trichonephila clavipes]|nr:hypothetical protein TNCV_822541 [Trichonephila clavipes]
MAKKQQLVKKPEFEIKPTSFEELSDIEDSHSNDDENSTLADMTTSLVMQTFVSGLKSKNEDVRFRTTRDLHHYVTTELREMTIEEISGFLDEFNHHIFEMVSSSDVNDKKGGTLAIVCLLGINVGNTATRTSRFVNYLRNLLPSSDTGVMELAAYAIGRLALVSGTYTAEYVEFEAKRAFEWLSGDRHETKRHGAVLVLRELAVSTPTFFFQQVQQFFDCIFNASSDPKPSIRESAAAALRAALVVTAQRETKETQKTFCYKKIPEGSKLANMVAKLATNLGTKNEANLALPPRFRKFSLNRHYKGASDEQKMRRQKITSKEHLGWEIAYGLMNGTLVGKQEKGDESTFEILQNKAQFVRRHRREKFHSDCVVQTVKHPTKIMIWSVINSKGTGRLYVAKGMMRQDHVSNNLARDCTQVTGAQAAITFPFWIVLVLSLLLAILIGMTEFEKSSTDKVISSPAFKFSGSG